jgi:hypothetical protein
MAEGLIAAPRAFRGSISQRGAARWLRDRPGEERLRGFRSSYGQTNSCAAELSPPLLQETDKMTGSRHARSDDRNKPVRKHIEAERERDKRKEDEVAMSSDDSFPASDPPSFTGVTSAADVERKRKKVNGMRTN